MAKAVGLTTALLPVAGVLVRGTSFRSAGFAGDRWQLAWSASLSQLVTTGLFAILPQIIGIGAIALAWGSLVRVAHARHLGSATYTTGVRLAADIQMLRTQIDAVAPGDTEALAAVSEKLNALQPEVDAFNLDYEQVRGLIESFDDDPVVRRFNRLSSPRLLGAVAVAIALLTVLVGSPFLPVLLAEMVAPVLLVAVYRVSRKDPLVTFSRIWPLVVVILLVAAVVSGLSGDLAGVAPSHYAFRPTAGISDGDFQAVAQADGLVYLDTCRPQHRQLVAVQQSDIATVRPLASKPNETSLWQILIDGAHLRFGVE